jgi:hypothetical protein
MRQRVRQTSTSTAAPRHSDHTRSPQVFMALHNARRRGPRCAACRRQDR